MTSPCPLGQAALPMSRVRQVDQVCDRFEAAWKAVGRGRAAPRLEDFVAGLPDLERRVLVRELIVLDIDYRRQAGQDPRPADYLPRFPTLDPAWLEQELASSWAEAGLVGESIGDFRLLREVGRGGMGVVYEAEQVSLHRRVAVKVLPFAAALDSRQLQRFKNESLAAAQLHHTHIVPVHYVGCERGVHFYAMQYIDGQSLAAVLAGLRDRAAHEGKPGRPVAGSLSATTVDEAPGRLVPAVTAETAPVEGILSAARSAKEAAWFRTVAAFGIEAAEALDHAHQQGVIHRDVKPANLLVDGHGHLWVTDFGLAQVLSDPRLTLTGDLVGTLRYMSPEQAQARRGVVDHRTDVYALGATLYELLTLKPAVPGTDREELLRQIAFEEPRPPRRLNRAIPPELNTIVLKALEKNPAERYATAQEVADELRRFLQDEPIRARRPTLTKRLVRWSRRHRPLVTAVGALVLAVLLLGGAGLRWLQRQRAAVDVDLNEAELWQKQERWPEALQALERATGRLTGGGSASQRERVAALRRDVLLVYRLEEARLLASAWTGVTFDFAGADRVYVEAFAKHGLDMSNLAPEEAAERIRGSAIRTRLVAALDHWADVKEQLLTGSGQPLRVVAQLTDGDPWRQQLRDPQVRRDRAALERLAGEASALAQPPANLVLLGRALGEAKGRAAAVKLLRLAQQRYPADFWINFDLANLLLKEPATFAEAVGFFRAALALRPHNPVVHTNLGNALKAQGKPVEAGDTFRKVLAIDPDYAEAYGSLGCALRDQGKPAEAVAAYKKALARKPDLAWVHDNLGLALYDQGKLGEAVAAYRKALALQPDLAAAHYHLGLALRCQGKAAEAKNAFQKAAELQPDNAGASCIVGDGVLKQIVRPQPPPGRATTPSARPRPAGPSVTPQEVLLHSWDLGERGRVSIPRSWLTQVSVVPS